MKKIYVLLATVLVLFASCSKDSGTVTSESIFPNYSDVVIPVNIAPLNFMVSGAEKVKVNISGTSEYSFSNRGETVKFPLKRWKQMLNVEKGNSLKAASCVSAMRSIFLS